MSHRPSNNRANAVRQNHTAGYKQTLHFSRVHMCKLPQDHRGVSPNASVQSLNLLSYHTDGVAAELLQSFCFDSARSYHFIFQSQEGAVHDHQKKKKIQRFRGCKLMGKSLDDVVTQFGNTLWRSSWRPAAQWGHKHTGRVHNEGRLHLCAWRGNLVQ